MLRAIRGASLVALLFCSTQGLSFGLGLVFGNPSGISFKTSSRGATAIDGAISWDLGEEKSHIKLTADYLWHHDKHFYYGIGGQGKFISGEDEKDEDKEEEEESDIEKMNLKVRIPFGARKVFRDPPIEVFGELAALVGFFPSVKIGVGAAIGFRYYF